MAFNSWEFVLFFAVVYVGYLLLGDWRRQNAFLLVASYYFYAAWDWRFLFLLLISTLLDFVCAFQIDSTENPRRRRVFLIFSVVGNLTLLGFFKYFNFFLDSLRPLLANFGASPEQLHLHIVLPVGISFYTFQEMSYTIDVYRREIRATRSLRDFALFVAFFPHMVAGPIMRASLLLRQLLGPRRIGPHQLVTGTWLIFWGLWKKIVVADNMALIVDSVFAQSATAPWLTAYLGVLAFAAQIYADFSAYSDIARGLAQYMGIDLMRNFDLPYFASSPSDFWRRWHISLSSWLRDYLYISLGGSRGGAWKTYRNLLVTMLLGGLWHGAAWNYVWWGAYHGILLIGHRWLTERAGARAEPLGGWRRVVNVLVMFQFTLLGWLLFRCTRRVAIDGGFRDDSFRQILEMLSSFRNGWGFDATGLQIFVTIALFTLPLLVIQWFQFRTNDQFFMLRLPAPVRVVLVSSLALVWLMCGIQTGDAFIYFQF